MSVGRLRRGLGTGLGWISANRKELIRVSLAVEKVAEELARIRAALEENDDKEEK